MGGRAAKGGSSGRQRRPTASGQLSQRERAIRETEEAILRETGHRYERLVAFDRRGRVVFARDGEPATVPIQAEEIDRLRGAVDAFTHNHPSGASFSRSEVDFAVRARAREARVVTDLYRYRLIASRAVWSEREYFWRTVNQADIEVRAELALRIRAGTMTEEEAHRERWHGLWTRVAQDFARQIRYVRERRG